jgi:hypothetical protein
MWNPKWRYRASKTLSGFPSIWTLKEGIIHLKSEMEVSSIWSSNLNGKLWYHWTQTLHEGNIQPETISKGLIHQKTLNEGNIRLKP